MRVKFVLLTSSICILGGCTEETATLDSISLEEIDAGYDQSLHFLAAGDGFWGIDLNIDQQEAITAVQDRDEIEIEGETTIDELTWQYRLRFKDYPALSVGPSDVSVFSDIELKIEHIRDDDKDGNEIEIHPLAGVLEVKDYRDGEVLGAVYEFDTGDGVLRGSFYVELAQ